eukprot:12346330-Alexandrium_andersonii.AAC.1
MFSEGRTRADRLPPVFCAFPLSRGWFLWFRVRALAANQTAPLEGPRCARTHSCAYTRALAPTYASNQT